MLTLDQIKALCMQGESNRLDYKRDQYPFDNAADGLKAELLKDILSFANSFRSEPAYILIGVEELESKLGRIVGIEASQVIDGSKIQQFVNEKTNRIIPFEAFAVDCEDGVHVVQVLEIAPCLKNRPFYLKQKNFAQLKQRDVWMRVGSASHIALPEEIKEMGLQEVEHESSPMLTVKFDIDNQVDDGLLSVVIQSDVNPPEDSLARKLSALNGGTDYDQYLWLRNNVSKLHFRLMLKNTSRVQADNLSIRYNVECEDGCVEQCEAPGFSSGSLFSVPRIADVRPVKANILRPGESDLDSDDLYFKVKKEGKFKLTTTILGKNLPVPLRETHEFTVRCRTVELDPDWIKQINFLMRDEEKLNSCTKWFVQQAAEELKGCNVEWDVALNSHWIPMLREVLAKYEDKYDGD